MLRRLAGHATVTAANAAWTVFQAVNRRIPTKSFQPKWATAPLLKSSERTKPVLGFPRQTDSLCPTCVKEVRAKVISGQLDLSELIEGNPGEIKAEIVERDGEVWMVKECPKHGRFEDIMSIDVDFMRRMEELFPGRDFRMAPDNLHNHGTSSIKYGRGAVLTVDLTNRCNMMCDPCFMDANQVGYVHELTLGRGEEDPRRLHVHSSPGARCRCSSAGASPPSRPIFLRTRSKYARERGLSSAVQCRHQRHRDSLRTTDFAFKAAGNAGMRLAYLQFDGIGDDGQQSHRKVGNLFEVKLRAIDEHGTPPASTWCW